MWIGEGRIRDVAEKIWFGRSRRGRVRVSSRLEEDELKNITGKTGKKR